MMSSKKITFHNKEYKGFLVDEMHGKLLKWLRILGYYSEDMAVLLGDREEFKDIRALKWFIFDYTQNHRLILLSSNISLCESVPHSFYLDLRDFKENLSILKQFFNLNYDFDLNHSFCPLCGFDLEFIREKNKVKNFVPPFTFSQQNEFWRCKNPECAKIYWRGTHVEYFKDIFEYLSK
jgi:uncharacterized protein with PIN domain